MGKRLDQCESAEEVAAVRKIARDYYQANRERCLAQSKAAQIRRYAETPQLILARNNRWRDAHYEHVKAAALRYYYRHRDEISARKKAERLARNALERGTDKDT